MTQVMILDEHETQCSVHRPISHNQLIFKQILHNIKFTWDYLNVVFLFQHFIDLTVGSYRRLKNTKDNFFLQIILILKNGSIIPKPENSCFNFEYSHCHEMWCERWDEGGVYSSTWRGGDISTWREGGYLFQACPTAKLFWPKSHKKVKLSSC